MHISKSNVSLDLKILTVRYIVVQTLSACIPLNTQSLAVRNGPSESSFECALTRKQILAIWVKHWKSMIEYTFEGNYFYTKCIKYLTRCRKKQSPQEEPRQPRRSRGSFSAPQIQRTLRIPSFHDPLKKSWKTHKTSRIRWSWELNWRNRVHIVGMLCRHILLPRVGWEPV